ncbi:hypothetical protein H2201_008851 [Coniosporium apollinis]|uniref:Dynamin family protein n=1 Tax=Coniosporium apollinis TaxID=61459 RepID=A0ABQ9NF77_9PEZI|nr:hypothetical protein H2201_008851 [Coniosporium apollinis]
MAIEPSSPGRSLNTSSLEALQDADQRKIMDAVDKLRRIGLNSVLQLPQLIVCGDQSSGKSSVLEAITQIPFPRKENLCTRFATEIVLRRGNTTSVKTKITPDKRRPTHEQDELEKFNASIKDFSEVPSLILEAARLMGLDGATTGSTKAFSRDVLSIEICGPDRPQLTLVDLPGLIHSENKSQSKDDVQLIRSLVEEYIRSERTIILAVISAKNDYANQIILQDCRRVDVKGSRTLGIITKPDFLRAGSDNERDWIELAQNRDVYFELGWHVLKNRTDDQLHCSFEERNQSEDLFFSKGSFRDLPQGVLGIESLRKRLSRLLNDHLKKELPDLKKELDRKWRETDVEFSRLGERRSTISEQRQYLMRVSMTTHDILRSAVQGHYEHSFFGAVDTHAAVDAAANIQRLRAVVQYLNLQFAERMRRYGHKYAIDRGHARRSGLSNGEVSVEDEAVSAPASSEEAPDEEFLASVLEDVCNGVDPLPQNITRPRAVDWVLRVLQRTRGRELPGNFNPMLISQLFWEQSEPWKALALAHIDRVGAACSRFVELVLQKVTTPEVWSRLLSLRVEGALSSALASSRAELGRIIEDKLRHPITYNHYYTTTVQKIRQKKYSGDLMRLTGSARIKVHEKNFLPGPGYSTTGYIDPQKLEVNMKDQIEQDMDKFSAEEALDCQTAYYKDELKYFIGVVTRQVIERHLVDTLPANIVSPMVIAGLSDEEISSIAAEPAEVTAQRDSLESRKRMLESGQEIFRLAMGGIR